MTTNPNDDDLENRSKQTEPLPDRETLPPQDESTQEADSSPDDPLQELRDYLQSEDKPKDSSNIFTRMTGSITSRKSTQNPKDENGSNYVFGVRTAGNPPFEPDDKQEPDSDSTGDTVILRNPPPSGPFIHDLPKISPEDFEDNQDETTDGEGEEGNEDESSPSVSRVRPVEPEEVESSWKGDSTEQLTDEKPSASILEEKIAQPQGERKRLKSGLERQQKFSRFISYNPKRSAWEQFRELSRVEKTLIFALVIAVIGLVSLIAYLFIMSRQPGFIIPGAALVPTPTPVATEGPPVPVGLRLTGGWNFVLESGVMVNGEWNPTTSEWLVGTELRKVVAIPWNEQVEAVVKTFKEGDPLELQMSNGDSFTYKVLTVSEIPVDDTSILYDVRPTLAVILIKPDADKRWVVVAEPQQQN